MGLLDNVKPAKQVKKRLKAVFWGDFGTGKTTNALKYEPPVLVIDDEKGTEHYGDHYDFLVYHTRSYQEIKAVVKELVESKCVVNGVRIETLVIDSLTVFYNLCQQWWFEYFQAKNNNPLYQLQPKDWSTIKTDFKELIDELLLLDVNVIVTAHQKTNYKSGSFMEIDQLEPYKPSLPDDTPHYFDVVLRFVKDKGKYSVFTNKCRILNKDGREALPAKIENIDNHNFCDELMKYVKGDKIVKAQDIEKKNIAVTAENVPEEVLESIFNRCRELNWDANQAVVHLQRITGKTSTKDLTVDEAYAFQKFLYEQVVT